MTIGAIPTTAQTYYSFNLLIITIMAKKNVSFESLKNANKQVKTISGVCKIIRAFWADGYKKAFTDYDLQYDDFKDVPKILSRLQKNDAGDVYIVARRATKNENGEVITDKDGKKVMESYDKVITTWSATTLYNVLKQTNEASK
jgi:hypothetical protein